MSEGESKGPLLGMRHIQTFLLFFGIVAIYISRVNIGVAVVAMTNAATTNPEFLEFDWSKKEIAYIFSSFYWGYFVTQFPGGALCKYLGVKNTIGWAIFISTVLSAITPYCVLWKGWQAFCLIRCIQGLAQGVIFPCVLQHLAKWSPAKERNRLGAFSFTGLECGTVLALALSGVIAKGPLGWPGISYVSAAIGFVWCLLWLVFGANSAGETRFISKAERNFIDSSRDASSNSNKKNIPIPWKAIVTSGPFLALVVVRCAQLYGISTLQTQIPSYLHGILKMEIKSNALYSAMPFLASWFTSFVYMFLGDVLQGRGILSLTALRRTFSSLSSWIPALGLIAIGFMNEQTRSWALAIMTLSVAANSGKIIGIALNNIDLSPNHAGLLMSLSNTPACFMSVIAPLVVGFIVTDGSSRLQWQIVFAIAAVIFFFGNLVYIIWGSTDTQPWNDEDFLAKDSAAKVTKGSPLELPDIAYKKPKV
ncbi:putative inorganic phosphate cotransporter [Stomoxys calcitrans]|uniref:putative inorganic phosphate cotransporter n=1 Tax=Stomoxys calcitrans TaxID=35570 RepID=UPI0027E3AC34|nr:putative inorganic phosphate cotransporter [Stomoxys calcitrans]